MMTRGRDVKFDLILHKIYEMRLLNPRNWLEYVTCVAMEKFAEQIFDPSLQAFANYTGHSFNNRRYELVNHLTKLYAMLNKK